MSRRLTYRLTSLPLRRRNWRREATSWELWEERQRPSSVRARLQTMFRLVTRADLTTAMSVRRLCLTDRNPLISMAARLLMTGTLGMGLVEPGCGRNTHIVAQAG